MSVLLRHRHRKEAEHAAKIQRRIAAELGEQRVVTETAGGDPRYRLPAIGLNPGAMPGTRPDAVVR